MAAFAGPTIDRQALHEIADLAAGLHMVTQTCAAILDGAPQHCTDGGDKPLGAPAANRAGLAARRQPGPEQRLAGIDIADTGDKLLVEKRRLDRTLSLIHI